MSNFFGGYGTLLVYDAATGEVRYLDNNGRFPGRGPTPELSFATAGGAQRAMMRTAQAVSTPGNLRGIRGALAAARLAALAGPAARQRATELAGVGFEIDARLAHEHREGLAPLFRVHEGLLRQRTASRWRPADRLVQTDLAAPSDSLPQKAAPRCTAASWVEALVAQMERDGGFLAMDDLTRHEAEWFEPISIDYRGLEVVTAGPPSNSFAALVAMGIMSRYDNAASGSELGRVSAPLRRSDEARLLGAPGARRRPEDDPPPLAELLSQEAYWQRQADAQDGDRASRFDPPGATASAGADTTHFVVADRRGNVVSATITLGTGLRQRGDGGGHGDLAQQLPGLLHLRSTRAIRWTRYPATESTRRRVLG